MESLLNASMCMCGIINKKNHRLAGINYLSHFILRISIRKLGRCVIKTVFGIVLHFSNSFQPKLVRPKIITISVTK